MVSSMSRDEFRALVREATKAGVDDAWTVARKELVTELLCELRPVLSNGNYNGRAADYPSHATNSRTCKGRDGSTARDSLDIVALATAELEAGPWWKCDDAGAACAKLPTRTSQAGMRPSTAPGQATCDMVSVLPEAWAEDLLPKQSVTIQAGRFSSASALHVAPPPLAPSDSPLPSQRIAASARKSKAAEGRRTEQEVGEISLYSSYVATHILPPARESDRQSLTVNNRRGSGTSTVGHRSVRSVAIASSEMRFSESSVGSAVDELQSDLGDNEVVRSTSQRGRLGFHDTDVRVTEYVPGGTSPRPQLGHRRSTKFVLEKTSWFAERVGLVVRNQYFDYVVGSLLLLNAFAIGLQVDLSARGFDVTSRLWTGISWLFCLLYTVELSLRMFYYKRRFWKGKGWQWNWFDTVVVVFQIVEEIFSVVLLSSGDGTSSLTLIRFVRILRLLRVVRLVRILRIVRELNILMNATVGSAKSFIWTVVLMLMMFYVCAIFVTQLVTDNRRAQDQTVPADKDEEDMVNFYGTVGDSVLSLFEAMMGGKDWADLMDPLRAKISPLMAVFFSMYIAFSMLVVLNLVTGIFVDSAQASIREHRDLDLVNRMSELFFQCDQDHTGEITWSEFNSQSAHPHMEEYFKAVDLDPSEAKGLWVLLDRDDSGHITIEEFVSSCLRLRGPARSTDMAALMYNMRWKFKAVMDVLVRTESLVDQLTSKLGTPRGSSFVPSSGPDDVDVKVSDW